VEVVGTSGTSGHQGTSGSSGSSGFIRNIQVVADHGTSRFKWKHQVLAEVVVADLQERQEVLDQVDTSGSSGKVPDQAVLVGLQELAEAQVHLDSSGTSSSGSIWFKRYIGYVWFVRN
jgi:hypothetical protein